VVAKALVREIRITEKAARAWNKERVRRDIGLLGVWKGALQIQFVRKRLVEMNKRVGRYLRQSEVGPIFMVIAHILGQQPLEVLLIQDDHVVERRFPSLGGCEELSIPVCAEPGEPRPQHLRNGFERERRTNSTSGFAVPVA
jgi:hypothetical protein